MKYDVRRMEKIFWRRGRLEMRMEMEMEMEVMKMMVGNELG